MKRFVLMLLLAGALTPQAQAADSKVTVVNPPPVIVEAAPAPVVVEQPLFAPLFVATPPVPEVVVKQPPRVQYGCKRIYRCDAQVCEWRRGCWGIYGYVEGPYYSQELAKRQWERDGLPGPEARSRSRSVVTPSISK